MIDISSKTNEHFRRWLDLSSARGIKKHKEFILMGEKLIQEFLKNPTYKVKAEIIHEELSSLTPVTKSLQGQRLPLYKLSKALFNEIDVIGTHFNLLVLELPEFEALDLQRVPQGLELIAPLGDPSNMGALIRSAVAFGTKTLVLCEESCNPFHPKSLKASAGTILKINILKTGKFSDLVALSKDLYALDMVGENVASFPWPKNLRLAIGEEGPGFSGIKGLQRLSVQTAQVESLNATVAASIALFSYAQHFNKQ